MKVNRVPIVLPEWPRLREKPEREPGIHVSGVIQYIMEKLEKRKDSGWDMDTTQRLGLLFEETLAMVYGEGHVPSLGAINVEVSPGLFVWFTPDGYDPRQRIVHEYKFWWRSARTYQPSFDFKVMAQVKSYCKVLGVNEAWLTVMFIMGEYKGKGPLPIRFELEFTDEELQDNWEMLVNHALQMQKEGRV